jgi:hypothetical protein
MLPRLLSWGGLICPAFAVRTLDLCTLMVLANVSVAVPLLSSPKMGMSMTKYIDEVALRDGVFKRVGYAPHRAQRVIHASHARHRVAACGRRFGKSLLGGNELSVEAFRTRLVLPQLQDSGKRREFWIVGPNYTDAEKEFRAAYNGLARVGAPFDKPGTYNDPHSGDMQISLFNGKFIVIAKSAQYPERLVGEGLNGVIMAEAAKQKSSTWNKYIRPMLADFNGWSLHSSTPEGKNWFYEAWMRGQSQFETDWESWRMPAWRNPYVYPLGASKESVGALRHAIESKSAAITPSMMTAMGVDPEVGALMKDLTRESFNAEIAAEFTEFVGRVFKDFDEEIHVKDFNYNPLWPIYAAADYGFTNPFVWLLVQVDPFGAVWVLDEMYERGLTIDEAGDEILRRGLRPHNLRMLYPDPASPGDTRALEKKLHIRGMRGTGGLLNNRLRFIRAALKERNTHLPYGDPERQPMLFINRRCKETIREFGTYRYPQTSEEAADRGKEPSENPLKKDDHTPETLGRFFAGHFAAPEEGRDGRRGSRMSDADVS